MLSTHYFLKFLNLNCAYSAQRRDIGILLRNMPIRYGGERTHTRIPLYCLMKSQGKTCSTTPQDSVSLFFYVGRNKRARSRLSEAGRGRKNVKRMLRKKCEALLRKGECRLWTNTFVRERPSPFLKPRPTDAFRNILLSSFTPRPSSSGPGSLVYDCR